MKCHPRRPQTAAVVTGALLLPLLLTGRALLAQAAPPTPTPANAAAAAANTANAVAAPVRQSWTADRRTFVVGDLITVLIDDYTVSTAVKENLNTDARTRQLSGTASIPNAISQSAGLQSNNSADQQQRGTARRENRFQNEMSVRVVAVSPNGLLQLKGTKNINVDKAAQDIVFTGWVRPQDISATNAVPSSRIADAQLAYTSPGPLGTPKQGIISKVLGVIWP